MNGSEIAQLRQRLEFEYRAGRWALHGLASGLAQHQFITARFQRMEQCHKRLTELVGEEQATDYLCEVFNETEVREQASSQADDVPPTIEDARNTTAPLCPGERDAPQ